MSKQVEADLTPTDEHSALPPDQGGGVDGQADQEAWAVFGGVLTRGYLEAMSKNAQSVLAEDPSGAQMERLREWLESGSAHNEILDEIAEPVVAALLKAAPRLGRGLRRDRRKLIRQVERVWGRAHQMYEATAYASYDLGANLAAAPRRSTIHTWQALLELHARSCRVAGEVLHLLRGGYPAAATARWRSLHELAVVAFVLRENPDNIAERYLDHAVVEQYEDAVQYQKHCERLGREPFEDGVLDELKARRDLLVTKYGASFDRPLGWAAPLLPKGSSGLVALERLVSLDHLRPFYRLGSHDVHAGSRGGVLNLTIVDGRAAQRPGATVFGDHAEVAHGALISLSQVTAALVGVHVSEHLDIDAMVSVKCMMGMVERCAEEFHKAAEQARRRGWLRDE